jgi:hypothetical protein
MVYASNSKNEAARECSEHSTGLVQMKALTMLPDFSGTGKTVQSEAIRLTEMVITKQVLHKTIDDPRAKVLFTRITNVLYTIYNDDINALLELEAIEAVICCGKCNGTGVMVTYNGFDAGDMSVATDTEIVSCPCCGG